MIELMIRGVSTNGVCSLSGKEGETIDVQFRDGTVNGPLSFKSFLMLLRMKSQQPKEAPRANGTPSLAAPVAVPPVIPRPLAPAK